MAVIKVAHDDPYLSEVDEDGDPRMPGIHGNYNDSIGVKMASPRLAGRTSILPTNIGPMEEITVDLPLHLENEHLSIDLSDIQDQLDALDVRIDALEATAGTHTTNIASNLSAINAEITARGSADTALGNRITPFEGVSSPVVLTGTNLAGLGTPTGLPAGRTCLGFARDTNKLYVWDPDGPAWVILN